MEGESLKSCAQAKQQLSNHSKFGLRVHGMCVFSFFFACVKSSLLVGGVMAAH